VENADAIIALEGIDGGFLGNHDLALDMGLAMGCDEHEAEVERVRQACEKAGNPAVLWFIMKITFVTGWTRAMPCSASLATCACCRLPAATFTKRPAQFWQTVNRYCEIILVVTIRFFGIRTCKKIRFYFGLLRLRQAASVKFGLPRVGLHFTWLPALSSLGQNKT
jgi:hypothetical protein